MRINFSGPTPKKWNSLLVQSMLLLPQIVTSKELCLEFCLEMEWSTPYPNFYLACST